MANRDALTSVRLRRATVRRAVPVTTPAHRKAAPEQVRNAAGGYVFGISDEAALHRFLIMGTTGGTYYVKEAQLTKDNAEIVMRAAKSAPLTLVRAIVEVSKSGRAPKQDAAIFALAIAASVSDDAGRKAALDALPEVCRTASTLFKFLKYVEQFRGWGRGLRKAVGAWYDNKDADKLAVQLVKYRNRDGWSHVDALRQAHTRGTNDAHRVLYNYVAGRTTKDRDGNRIRAKLPEIVLAFEALKRAKTVGEVERIVNNVDGVTWEMIPDEWINERSVWELLLSKGVPQGALIRQLPRLTRLGLTADSTFGVIIERQLVDTDKLKYARIHPVKMLVAQKTYSLGHNEHGTSWTPTRRITDALDAGFYASLGALEPSGKATLIGVDCSDSMRWPTTVCSYVPLSALEAISAVAMAVMASESSTQTIAFDTRAWEFGEISPRRRLDDNMASLRRICGGGTDVSQPIQWATKNRVHVDSFQILTDGESWRGTMHPFEAFKIYRDRINPDARLAVAAVTSTRQSVVPPFEPQAIDVCGFDANTPQILADFAAGRI